MRPALHSEMNNHNNQPERRWTMKTKQILSTAALLTLAFVLAACAQGPRGQGGPQGRGGQQGQGGPEGMGPPPKVEEVVVDLITEFDTDGDYSLSMTELKGAIAALPMEPTPLSDAADWIVEYDEDGTGTLSASELAIGLEENRPHKGRRGPPENR
jgi:predicted small secreted protein